MEEPDYVEFICRPEDEGVPEPKAASNVLPEWYKMLPGTGRDLLNNDTPFVDRTVRLCPAFLDALSLGWVLSVEADIRVNAEGDGVTFEGDGTVSRREIGNGEYEQAVTAIEIQSSWAAKVPDGYSILVLPPMNRREQRFDVVGQVIDADQNLTTIDVPALWKADSGRTIIRAGKPLAQVIPFKRDSRLDDALVRPFGTDGKRSYSQTSGKTSANKSWYRQNEWEPKGTKIIS